MCISNPSVWPKRLIVCGMLAFAVISSPTLAQARSYGGAKWHQDRVEAEDYDFYKVNFRGGEFAQVRLHSYGATYLNLLVYDQAGKLVASDFDRSTDALATWKPSAAGTFTIVVVNQAAIANSYFLSTN